jgi:hypothetical protein
MIISHSLTSEKLEHPSQKLRLTAHVWSIGYSEEDDCEPKIEEINLSRLLSHSCITCDHSTELRSYGGYVSVISTCPVLSSTDTPIGEIFKTPISCQKER